jgi:hypothetical protein
MALNYTPMYNQPVARTTNGSYYSPSPVLGESTSTTTKTGGGSGVPPVVDTSKTQIDALNNSVETLSGNFERDYNDALSQADTAEMGLRSQAGEATSELQRQAKATEADLASQQATGIEGVTSQEQLAQKQSKSALQQARDLFRQTQQGNIAQLSGLGISSSSVSEALAEKLGVETARRIAGVTGSRDEVLANLSKEKARINDFAATKKTQLAENLQAQIGSIQNSLLLGLKQVSDARQMAATAKANARATLLSQAQQQIGSLQANAQQFAQQLQQWATQKSTIITDAQKGFTISPTDTTGLQSALTEAVSPMAPAGFSWNPNVETAPSGYKRVGVNLVKNKSTEDPELQNDF